MSKKTIRDKFLYWCSSVECRVLTYIGVTDGAACPSCDIKGTKMRDPL